MKLPVTPNLPQVDSVPALKQRLSELLRAVAVQVNGLSEGSISASYQAAIAAPTAGTYQQGDFVRNLTPTEAGSSGSKYVVTGWICTASGTPGTWVATRSLTGN